MVFIVTFPRQRFLHITGIPHVGFSQYGREEAIQILGCSPLPIFDRGGGDSINDNAIISGEDLEWLWMRFLEAVWESLATVAAKTIVSCRDLAEQLWIPFTEPIREGTHGVRDFSRLMVAKRSLFQNEQHLVGKIVQSTPAAESKHKTYDLPQQAKYILCAAFLASYNPAKMDPIFFMKSSEKKRKRRKGGTKSGRPSKHRRITRRVLGPQAFSLERLWAIVRAIHPRPEALSGADLQSQVAMLIGRRLLRCNKPIDKLQPTAKWLINVTEEAARTMGRDIGFDIDEYLAE